MKKYDYLIIGAGFFGSICAYELTNRGYKCLIIEKRNHIGGNCYTEKHDNIELHMYGAHIFHTSNEKVWNWINKFTKFNNYVHTVIANYKDELYSLPFNMWTFYQIYGIKTPLEMINLINYSNNTNTPKNFEEQAINTVGFNLYEKLIKGYTEKQWGKDPKELPKEIIKRLPIRFTFNDNYFNDIFQGIPIGGYTKIFEKLLNNIDVCLNVDYFDDKEKWNSISENIIYTGPIDKFYDYKYGNLEYKTVDFNHERISVNNFQGTSVINYTDKNIPYTRIIEHVHFELKTEDVTWITYETPVEYNNDKIPLYPVNDNVNNDIYNKYKELSNKETNVFFGGRLAEYKYYDMDKIIESALNFLDNL